MRLGLGWSWRVVCLCAYVRASASIAAAGTAAAAAAAAVTSLARSRMAAASPGWVASRSRQSSAALSALRVVMPAVVSCARVGLDKSRRVAEAVERQPGHQATASRQTRRLPHPPAQSAPMSKGRERSHRPYHRATSSAGKGCAGL